MQDVAEVSRHKCLIYDGHPSEQLPVVVPLIQEGLRDRHRCLYLGDPETVSMVDAALAEKGVDTAEETRRGALVYSSDRSHLNGGFDPRAMVGMLRKLIDDALRDGFRGLCATGDMMWELGTDRNFDRLQEYEALLEQVFHEKPLMGVCQYRRDTVPPRAIREALLTHRSVYVGAHLNRDNLFYMPPELLLPEADVRLREAQGEWMCQQITRVLQAEQKRDEALAAQRRLAEDLERRVRERTAELEAANKELESFSYSVSHDLRAPLRAIDGFSKMLLLDQAPSLDAEGKRRLKVIGDSALKMGQLIDDLLKFSRTGRSEMKAQVVDMNALVRATLSEAVPANKAQVVVGDLPPAAGDLALLKQVLANLLGNAVKYSSKRAEPRIEIGATPGARETTYWIKDNGAGFDMANAGKLFKVFQRLHGPSEFEGTGIGLALVQRIVQRHGGRVWAEGVEDQGATFSFTLPRP
ncbi:MAG TPA: MEDS domain-containing protein [Planctomycetota bacterium]